MWHCMTKLLLCATILHHHVYSCLTSEVYSWKMAMGLWQPQCTSDCTPWTRRYILVKYLILYISPMTIIVHYRSAFYNVEHDSKTSGIYPEPTWWHHRLEWQHLFTWCEWPHNQWHPPKCCWCCCSEKEGRPLCDAFLGVWIPFAQRSEVLPKFGFKETMHTLQVISRSYRITACDIVLPRLTSRLALPHLCVPYCPKLLPSSTTICSF